MYWFMRGVIALVTLYVAWIAFTYVFLVVLACVAVYLAIWALAHLVAALVGTMRARREKREAW